jgi:exodeoxyribonuclease VII large subunit
MIYTVAELTGRIKSVIEDALPFVWVRGQISNLARPGSGHLYFTLKDEDACLNVVWFKGKQRRASGVDPLTGEVYDEEAASETSADRLGNGQEVLCGGRLTVYPPRGAYQLVAEMVQDAGLGRLHLEFEALKRKFAGLGYFDAQRKRPLPRQPRRVAVITAPGSAAMRDFARIASDRGLPAQIRVFPTLVQGEEAPAQIAAALDEVNAQNWAQLAVLIRGGGSLEDLWAYNTELVVEAIARSAVPVLTGVGHEVDTSLADLVADLRAATPSHAAQLLWTERRELAQSVDACELELYKWRERYFAVLEQRVRGLEKALTWLAPSQRVERLLERVNSASQGLERGLERVFQRNEEQVRRVVERLTRAYGPREIEDRAAGVEALAERLRLGARDFLALREQGLERAMLALDGLDPRAPLRRGYSLVTARASGRLLRSVRDVAEGELLDILVQDGRVESRVTGAFVTKKDATPE